MKWFIALVLCVVALACVQAQRFNNNFRQFNFNNNNNNFRPNNNNFRPNNNNFRPNNNVRTFNFNNNNNNNNNRNNNNPRGTNPNFAFGLDTSDGRYAKFEGPVKGIPRDHGGGRFGAADCLLCPNGF